MAIIQIFSYKGSNITFNRGDCVMVNATEMAKPFKKKVAHWFNNDSTKSFIEALARSKGIKSDVGNPTSLNTNELALSYPTLIKVVKGGTVAETAQGTWMHEDVVLEFARWLSPEFAIWCNDRIKELLRFGMTATETTIDSIIADPESGIKLLQALKQEREAKAKLQAENQQQQVVIEQRNGTIAQQEKQLKEAAPKVKYVDDTLQSVNTLTTTQVAKSLGMNVDALTKKLKEIGVIYRQSNQWMLKNPYCKWNLHSTRTSTFTRSDGTVGTNVYTVWTERGRYFIDALHKNNFDIKASLKYIQGNNEEAKA